MVYEIEHFMSYAEFIEWQVYYNKEPFLADRLEYQMGTLSYLTSLNLGEKKQINDFLISHKEIKKVDKEKNLEDKISSLFSK